IRPTETVQCSSPGTPWCATVRAAAPEGLAAPAGDSKFRCAQPRATCYSDRGGSGDGSMTKTTSKKLFGAGAFYLTLIDTITPIVLEHKYTFFSDEWFSEWTKSKHFSIERMNFILALELVEKAHLAAVSALFRAKRWADALCLMHDSSNFIGWA